jgi:hypothetical protein
MYSAPPAAFVVLPFFRAISSHPVRNLRVPSARFQPKSGRMTSSFAHGSSRSSFPAHSPLWWRQKPSMN